LRNTWGAENFDLRASISARQSPFGWKDAAVHYVVAITLKGGGEDMGASILGRRDTSDVEDGGDVGRPSVA
jgi:hypothetical protein